MLGIYSNLVQIGSLGEEKEHADGRTNEWTNGHGTFKMLHANSQKCIKSNVTTATVIMKLGILVRKSVTCTGSWMPQYTPGCLRGQLNCLLAYYTCKVTENLSILFLCAFYQTQVQYKFKGTTLADLSKIYERNVGKNYLSNDLILTFLMHCYVFLHFVLKKCKFQRKYIKIIVLRLISVSYHLVVGVWPLLVLQSPKVSIYARE